MESEASWKSHRVHYREKDFSPKIDPTQMLFIEIAMDDGRVQVSSRQGNKLQTLTVGAIPFLNFAVSFQRLVLSLKHQLWCITNRSFLLTLSSV